MMMSDEQRKAVMDAWTNWFGQLGDQLVDSGNPFGPAAKTLTQGGQVREGAIGEMATGYSIIKADSFDAAVDLAKSCPQLDGGAVTVYETFAVM